MLIIKAYVVVLIILPISIKSSDTVVQDDEVLSVFEGTDPFDNSSSEEIDNSIPIESITENYPTPQEHEGSPNAKGTLKIYTYIPRRMFFSSHEQNATKNYRKNLKKGRKNSSKKFFSSHEDFASTYKLLDNHTDTNNKTQKKDIKKDKNKLSNKYNRLSSHEVELNKTLSEAFEDFDSISNEHNIQNKKPEEKSQKQISDNEVKTSTEEIKDIQTYKESVETETKHLNGDETETTTAKKEAKDEKMEKSIEQMTKAREELEKTTAKTETKDEKMGKGTKEKEEVEKTTERTDTENKIMELRTKQREKTDINQEAKLMYPYTVSVQRKNAHHATGALLSPRWVISSGREFYHVRESIKLFKVRYGTVNCKRGPTVPIMAIVMHPGYQAPNYDLSLLKMGSAIPLHIKPIPLGSKYDTAEVLVTTYWARLIINGTVLPNDVKERYKSHSLRVSKQTLLPYDWCKDELKNDGVNLTFASFCLKPIVEHHSECLQDPGAPVVFNNALYGISSGWSGSCHDGARFTVTAAITGDLMKDWIVGTISG